MTSCAYFCYVGAHLLYNHVCTLGAPELLYSIASSLMVTVMQGLDLHGLLLVIAFIFPIIFLEVGQ